MPLMNRTVREDSGAWSLLKNAPVRARETASSSGGVAAPKFPGNEAGTAGCLYTARMRPSLSTTAIVIALDCAALAATCISICTSACVSASEAGGGGGGVVLEPPPPPQATSPAQSAMTSQKSSRKASRPRKQSRKCDFGAKIIRVSYSYHTRTSFSIIPRRSCSIMIE